MTHLVTIHQLTSPNNGSSFLNVDCEDGHIGVWSNIQERPTYLATYIFDNRVSSIKFIQFDSQEYADEYIEAYKHVYSFQRLG